MTWLLPDHWYGWVAFAATWLAAFLVIRSIRRDMRRNR